MSARRMLSLAACLLGLSGPARATGHREAPGGSPDAVSDQIELWAWVQPTTRDKLHVVAAFHPFREPASGPIFPGFADDALYELHVARGPNSLADVITYQIRFKTAPLVRVDPADLTKPVGGGKEFMSPLAGRSQTYTVTKVVAGQSPVVIAANARVAPPRVGSRTSMVVDMTSTYDDAYAATFIQAMASGEGRVWAGPRDDGRYKDRGGLYDVIRTRAKGVAQDAHAGFNCLAIVLEIPTVRLTANGQMPPQMPTDAATLGLWASLSRRQVTILNRDGTKGYTGPWVQVARGGFPLFNQIFIGLQDRDRYNAGRPANDLANFGAYFLNPVIVRDAEAVGVYSSMGVDPVPFKSNRLDIIDVMNIKGVPSPNAHNISLSATGDVLRVDLGIDSSFPNGRPIPGGSSANREATDVPDVVLSLLLFKLMAPFPDGVDYNDRNFLTTMPWLPLPWQSYDEGHGKPTP